MAHSYCNGLHFPRNDCYQVLYQSTNVVRCQVYQLTNVVRCITDLRTARGRLFSECLSLFQVTSFVVVIVAYGAIWIKIPCEFNSRMRIQYSSQIYIWIKIQRTAHLVSSSDTRYRNSARVMMIFVAVFILQVSCQSNL
jgi:hypothetical protein